MVSWRDLCVIAQLVDSKGKPGFGAKELVQDLLDWSWVNPSGRSAHDTSTTSRAPTTSHPDLDLPLPLPLPLQGPPKPHDDEDHRMEALPGNFTAGKQFVFDCEHLSYGECVKRRVNIRIKRQ
jgi:hypothetical protein